jgi:hypothetical protein
VPRVESPNVNVAPKIGEKEGEVDTSYNERNRQQTTRLEALRRLSDDDLSRPIGNHWTVGVALAHMTYWDARALGTVEAWRRYGVPLIGWTDEWGAVNNARLPIWRETPPRQALEEAITTAVALDGVIADLNPDEAEEVARVRYRILERALHRAEHLDEIEQALRS